MFQQSIPHLVCSNPPIFPVLIQSYKAFIMDYRAKNKPRDTDGRKPGKFRMFLLIFFVHLRINSFFSEANSPMGQTWAICGRDITS